MSRKTPGRALQRLVEEEIGMRPKLQTCHNIMRDWVRVPGATLEENLARAFEANRVRLEMSAKSKLASDASSDTGAEKQQEK